MYDGPFLGPELLLFQNSTYSRELILSLNMIKMSLLEKRQLTCGKIS